MASISSITAAAASVKAETTLTLANFNFEINLFTKRVSPPTEYEGVGKHLARSRLEEAQNGTQHTTARRLGLLFKSIPPSTPDLLKAYGTRASEISRSGTANPRGDAFKYGPFENRVGADATALWAAATSGHAAIQCHLLACMLARIWDAPEATSLWEEILARRKMEVAAKLEAEGEIDTDLMLAAAASFQRSDLADWDASCRSWLRVADSEKAVQQTKLRLIVDNVDLPVNTKPKTYESVLAAWTTAMEEMEKLLGGIHRPVQNGAVLLGLTAWHLYPDLQCLAAHSPWVKLKDHLFSGKGILTLGLEPAPGREARSVYWSLPLAHLRYYGLPVTKFSSTRTSERDRLTVDELLFAWFCACVKEWDSDRSIPSEVIFRYTGDVALRLHNALNKTHETSDTNGSAAPDSSERLPSPPRSWLLLLSQIAHKWAASLGQPRALALRNLGRNFCGSIGSPFRDIFTVNAYLDVAVKLEEKIGLLREIAISLSAQEITDSNYYRYLIMYPCVSGSETQAGFEIATACPEFGIEIPVDCTRAFRRWICRPPTTGSQPSEDAVLETRLRQIREYGEVAERHSKPFPIFLRKPPRTEMAISRDSTGPEVYVHRQRDRPHLSRAHAGSPLVMKLTRDSAYGYDVVFGDYRGVALLCRHGPHNESSPILHQAGPGPETAESRAAKPQYTLSTKKLMDLFKPDRIDFSLLATRYRELDFETYASLLGMTFINTLYSQLGNASVDVRAAKVDLNKAHWVKSAFENHRARQGRARSGVEGRGSHSAQPSDRILQYLDPSGADTATTFACIAMMETGSFNFHPSELSSVFALCSADSMYVASALLCDPAQYDHRQVGIKRVTGNIGRAGMALMIPPPNPTVRSYEVDDWYLYQHQAFDGVLDDSFGGTSLQLLFTEWKQEVNVGTTGGKDVEAYFLETLVSVYDKDKWIADLDVLSTFRSQRLLTTFLSPQICACSTTASSAISDTRLSAPLAPAAQSLRLISVGNFAEIVVAPSGPGIITAKGNWQARLAAASICIAKGYRVILTPHGCCWPCLSRASIRGESVSSIIKTSGNILVMIL